MAISVRRQLRELAAPAGRAFAPVLALLVAASSCGVTPMPQTTHVLVGAGDIASCNSRGDERTALLLDELEGTIFTAGDNAYPDGSARDFLDCYDPSWGRHKRRTRPAPGNHDYVDGPGAGYHAYFGESAGALGKGYYSYAVGDWHVVALNSVLEGSAHAVQLDWLRHDLTTNAGKCLFAYWHHPLFSSGNHSRQDRVRGFWEVLFEHGADVVVNGHDHHYERFLPLTPGGAHDPRRGIRQFIVGTGGQSSGRQPGEPGEHSAAAQFDASGVLKFVLYEGRYDWEFVPVPGRGEPDRGTGSCGS